MTISFNTIPSNTLVPLFYAEMDNQAANTAQDSGASLLIGHANNGAEIVANSLVLMPSADYARQICGAGSQLARMVEAYRQTDPFGELYVIAVPEATGAAATVTLTVTGAATETGTVNVYVGRTRVQAPVTNGDNVTTIASSIQDAINAVPALPFTASSSAGVVTLTARHKGLCGNEIPVSLNYYGFGGGEVLPAGVQIAVAAGTAGTGAPVLTGAVAAMADEPFDYIGLPFNDTASVNTLVTEMNDTSGRWSYARQLYGHVYTAKIGTLSELVTAGDQFNQQHITLAGYEKETQTPADELAASRTARAAVFIRNDPARPTQTGELVGMLPALTTSAVMQNAAVGQSTTPAQSSGWPSVTHPALNNAPAVKNTVDLPTWEELTDIRDTLNTAIDKELSRTTSDALFLALRRVKADLNADINTRLEQSALIIQRTPDEVLPALVLAATWFDNAARDADIIRCNAITHPGFVPVIPLKVPVQ